jgi:hypothetical protein
VGPRRTNHHHHHPHSSPHSTSRTHRGEFGIYLDEYLSKGETGRCATFDNAPLTGHQGSRHFDVRTVEVYAFRDD